MSFIKYAKKLALCSAVAISLVSTAIAVQSVEAQEMRGWNIHVEDYPNSIALESFVKEVSEKTDGRIGGKVFHGGVLGSQPDAIEQVRLGAVDFGNFNLGPMGQVVPETNVVSLPFIFKSIPDMYKVMDGEGGAAIAEGMAKKGIVVVGWFDSGARSFYTSQRAINTPDDVKGLKVRVMNNDLFVGMIEAMGGNATPMAFGEVFQSLKTGVVDGAENNPPSYESTNHFEVAQFYSLSEHLIIPECLCISKKTWDTWSEADQKIVMEAGKNAANMQRELWQAREKASMEKVAAGGVKVNTIADKGPFQDAMGPVYDKYLASNPDMKSLVDLIKSSQ